MSYQPLRGVKVLDIGWLIPPALTTQRLAAFGADVVKVEAPGRGDYLDRVPPFYAGHSPVHMTHNAGKRSIHLDVRDPGDRETLLRLAGVADVIVENSRPGAWLSAGVDFVAMRRARPELVVCSITGFGQTGPWASLPSHGLTLDALADALNIEWVDGEPRLGWVYTSWGSELGAQNAAMAVCAALAHVRGGGTGAWIDVSCWDAAVESHRNEVAADVATGKPVTTRGRTLGAIYEVYRAADGRLVLLAALEPKFWAEFCKRVDRADLLGGGGADEIDFGLDTPELRRELAGIFACAPADEWERRFLEWGVPGGPVLGIEDAVRTAQFRDRGIVEEREPGTYPVVTTPVRWHDHGSRAGAGLCLPPEHGADTAEVLSEWLRSNGRLSTIY
jgi:crotonobetainyl-CoA:carnitine CoA-transferase CaiB-like acyl-CoA transferase